MWETRERRQLYRTDSISMITYLYKLYFLLLLPVWCIWKISSIGFPYVNQVCTNPRAKWVCHLQSQRHSTIQESIAKSRYNLSSTRRKSQAAFQLVTLIVTCTVAPVAHCYIDASNRKSIFHRSLICIYISIVRWTTSPAQHTSSDDPGWHPPALSPEATSWRTGDSGSGTPRRTTALRLFYLW